jgi:hypothetical protein
MKKIPANETEAERMKRLDREASRQYVARRLAPTANRLDWYKQTLQASAHATPAHKANRTQDQRKPC